MNPIYLDNIAGTKPDARVVEAVMPYLTEKYAEAVKCFEKAAQATDNDVFSPIYLMKAAAVYEKMGQKADALKLYEKIKSEYPRSQQAQTIDSYIERAKLQ